MHIQLSWSSTGITHKEELSPIPTTDADQHEFPSMYSSSHVLGRKELRDCQKYFLASHIKQVGATRLRAFNVPKFLSHLTLGATAKDSSLSVQQRYDPYWTMALQFIDSPAVAVSSIRYGTVRINTMLLLELSEVVA